MTEKHIIEFAERAFQMEKDFLIGCPPDKIKGQGESKGWGYKSFLVKEDGLYMLPPPEWHDSWAFLDPNKEEAHKNVHSLWMRLFALAMEATAHIMISESWILKCCGACGEEKIGKDGCPKCGAHLNSVAPSKSEYSTEALNIMLEIKGQEKAKFWCAEIIRDYKTKKICDYKTTMEAEEIEISGRFTNPWAIQPWMTAHFAINYPVICQVLGKECPAHLKKLAEFADQQKPEGYKVVRFDEGTLKLFEINDGEMVQKGEAGKDFLRRIEMSN